MLFSKWKNHLHGKWQKKTPKCFNFQSFYAYFVRVLADFVDWKVSKGQQLKGWLFSSLFWRVYCSFFPVKFYEGETSFSRQSYFSLSQNQEWKQGVLFDQRKFSCKTVWGGKYLADQRASCLLTPVNNARTTVRTFIQSFSVTLYFTLYNGVRE